MQATIPTVCLCAISSLCTGNENEISVTKEYTEPLTLLPLSPPEQHVQVETLHIPYDKVVNILVDDTPISEEDRVKLIAEWKEGKWVNISDTRFLYFKHIFTGNVRLFTEGDDSIFIAEVDKNMLLLSHNGKLYTHGNLRPHRSTTCYQLLRKAESMRKNENRETP